MTTNVLSTVIGVFNDHSQAENAIDELRHNGFSYDRIRLVEHGTGSFMDTLKGMFTGQTAVASSTAESLVKMGMPDYESQHYQHELDADHVLLLMNADDRPEDAFNIMRQNGAFDINSRLRIAGENGSVEIPGSDVPANVPNPDNVPVRQNTTPPTSYKDRSQWAANPDDQPYPDRSQRAANFDGQPAVAPVPSSSADEYVAPPDAVDTSTAPESRM